MQPRIEFLQEKRLVGIQTRMSFIDNKTKELWQNFMPKKNKIKNIVSSYLFSLEVYNNPQFFASFDPQAKFDKWAAIEVGEPEELPEGMETITIPSGMYAVFIYKGTASDAPKIYQYIFATWLPASDYEIDDRPHFALMGEKYKNNDPESEEEIWIPIKSTQA